MMSEYEDSKYQNNQSEALLEANNLVYRFDDPLSISINRTSKKQFFATRTYTQNSGSCICDWNSGVDFIDGKNSYLKITMEVTGGDGLAGYTFGSGSVLNMFTNIKIMSSSGTELSRSENSNIFHKFDSVVRNSKLWYETVGALMNAPSDPNPPDNAPGDPLHGPVEMFANGEQHTFLVPLSELDPFFRLYDDKLMPSVLASGLRVELALEKFEQIFYLKSGSGDPITGFNISNIEFRNCSSTLMDSAQAVLNSEASKDGLEIEYDRYFVAPTAVGTAFTANIEIRKAVALCKSSLTVLIDKSDLNSLTNDGFRTIIYSYTENDSRIGNLYFNLQPITSPQENYFQLLKDYGKIKHGHLEAAVNYTSYTHGNSILHNNYERSDSLNLSSQPVNQSRVCEVRFERSNGDDAKAYTFMCYTALARTSLQNCSVKI